MPAAYYEFNLEQNANFVAGFKILNNVTGSLFKFLPNPNQTFWSNGAPTFDVPEEIKLAYPNINDAFGWLSTSTGSGEFLRISMKVKSNASSTSSVACGCQSWYRFPVPPGGSSGPYTNLGLETFSRSSCVNEPDSLGAGGLCTSNNISFVINQNSSGNKNNLIMSSYPTVVGKYAYDIELTYRLKGTSGSTYTPFVIRLMQGSINYTPNITT